MAIKSMLQRHMLYPEKLKWFVVGTDCSSAQHDGFTIAQPYGKHSFKMRHAHMDRINAWAEMLRLFIHDRCARLAECLPGLQHDPHRPEDVLQRDVDDDGMGGDDPADACRYLVNYKPPVVKQVGLAGFRGATFPVSRVESRGVSQISERNVPKRRLKKMGRSIP